MTVHDISQPDITVPSDYEIERAPEMLNDQVLNISLPLKEVFE